MRYFNSDVIMTSSLTLINKRFNRNNFKHGRLEKLNIRLIFYKIYLNINSLKYKRFIKTINIKNSRLKILT